MSVRSESVRIYALTIASVVSTTLRNRLGRRQPTNGLTDWRARKFGVQYVVVPFESLRCQVVCVCVWFVPVKNGLNCALGRKLNFFCVANEINRSKTTYPCVFALLCACHFDHISSQLRHASARTLSRIRRCRGGSPLTNSQSTRFNWRHVRCCRRRRHCRTEWTTKTFPPHRCSCQQRRQVPPPVRLLTVSEWHTTTQDVSTRLPCTNTPGGN